MWKSKIESLAHEVVEEYVEKPVEFWNSKTNRFEYERLGASNIDMGALLYKEEKSFNDHVPRDLDDPILNSDDDVPEQEEVLKSENFGYVRGVKSANLKTIQAFQASQGKRKCKGVKGVTLEVFSFLFKLSLFYLKK